MDNNFAGIDSVLIVLGVAGLVTGLLSGARWVMDSCPRINQIVLSYPN